MDDLGLVSIITPTYNCAQYIGETIDTGYFSNIY